MLVPLPTCRGWKRTADSNPQKPVQLGSKADVSILDGSYPYLISTYFHLKTATDGETEGKQLPRLHIFILAETKLLSYIYANKMVTT
ncbi:hypothetical protein DAI22_01g423400 [Oryza sativa Japonica Group]|nr:hypothetical protein DAI22_01g423400 [Oryza sativa Japonica Group]